MKPWEMRKEWASNQIKSGSKRGIIFIWLFALAWNALTLPVFFSEDIFSQISRDPEKAFVLLFPVVGLVLVGAALHSLVSWRKFGPSPLTMDPFPGSLGGHVGGFVDTNIPFSAELEFEVKLSCVKSYVSGSGKNRSRKESILWQSEGIAFSQASGSGTLLSFRFEPPDELPESDPKSGSTYYLWRLGIHCELEGADFDRQFEVPVFGGLRHSENIGENTLDFHRTFDSASEGISSVSHMQSIPGGIEVFFPALTRPASGIAGSIFGAIFLVAGYFLAGSKAPAIFPWVFGGIGLLIFLFGLWSLFKSLRVRITNSGIVARRFVLGYPITTRRIEQTELTKITIEQGATMSTGSKTTIYYSLEAHALSGQTLVIAERLTSRAEAEILKESFETYAGIVKQPKA